jgi:hypothetical protein
MTNEQFTELMLEVRAIRSALTQTRAPAAATPSAAPAAMSEEIPLPITPVENAGAVQVHFGKNTGRALADLGAKSVEWYAKEQPPKLMHDGTPFPPRPADVALREAARTLVHQRRGMIPTSAPVLQPEPISEEVPF